MKLLANIACALIGCGCIGFYVWAFLAATRSPEPLDPKFDWEREYPNDPYGM